MSKTLLLVICDFLLISVLALVRFDSPEEEVIETADQVKTEAGISDDINELLRISLEHEQAERERLNQSLDERESALEETTDRLKDTAKALNQSQAETEQIAEERKRIEAEKASLENQFEQTSQDLEATKKQRETVAADLKRQQEKAQALQEELKARQEALAQTESRLKQEAEARQELEKAKSSLETNLKISQAEKAVLAERVVSTEAQVETARQERIQAERRVDELSSRFEKLAEESSETRQEIIRSQPISLNQIFSRYEKNRLQIRFDFQIEQFIGYRNETAVIDVILVRQNQSSYLIFEGQDTPFRLESLGQLNKVNAITVLAGERFQITEVGFLKADPRVLVVQVPNRYIEAAQLDPFTLTSEPLRFSEVVLISNKLGDYGETSFRLLPGGGRYIEVPNSLLGRIVGEFSPSRGDYVFAKTGNLLGLMIKNDTGAILSEIDVTNHLKIGNDFDPKEADKLAPVLRKRIQP